jgi:hypothetical protein
MTKANRKRRNKGGRPRLENVEREPNGRPLRSQRKAETEKEARSVVITARMRHHLATEAECLRPEYGSALGRLYLTGHINKVHLEAGNRASEEYAKYYGLTGIPHPSAKAQDITRVKGMGGDVSYDTARHATNRMMLIEQALGGVVLLGCSITSVVKRVIVMDEEPRHRDIPTLVLGLNQLISFYGVDKMERAA